MAARAIPLAAGDAPRDVGGRDRLYLAGLLCLLALAVWLTVEAYRLPGFVP